MSNKGTDPIKAFFSGESLVIATKHAKERVLQPMLTQILGVEACVAPNFDTDRFGTFSHEILREGTPLETAREKCIAASHLTGCRLAIASEGSFGAHPVFSFVPADEELLLLTDLRHNLEFKVTHLSTRTNFAGSAVRSRDEAIAFAQRVMFPSHGLIARKNKDDVTDIRKGICSWEELDAAYTHFSKRYGTVFLETDMRACYNPTRMEVIADATRKLIEVIGATCPQCQTPGFSAAERYPGLPCGNCRRPTRSTLRTTCRCTRCSYAEEQWFPQQKQTEDPQFCDYCNP